MSFLHFKEGRKDREEFKQTTNLLTLTIVFSCVVVGALFSSATKKEMTGIRRSNCGGATSWHLKTWSINLPCRWTNCDVIREVTFVLSSSWPSKASPSRSRRKKNHRFRLQRRVRRALSISTKIAGMVVFSARAYLRDGGRASVAAAYPFNPRQIINWSTCRAPRRLRQPFPDYQNVTLLFRLSPPIPNGDYELLA